MRNKLDEKHLLNLCEPFDQGDFPIFLPPMKAQVAVNELCRYFLGEDWYDASGCSGVEQVNTAIVRTIEKKYRGCKIKRKR